MFVAASRNSSDSASRAYPTPPSCVSVRARTRADRRGEVGAAAGCRLVPENLAMSSYLVSWLSMRKVRSGNRVDERRRFERQAVRPFTPEEVRPSFAADRSGGVGLRTRAAEDAGALPIELRPEGRRDSNPQPQDPEGTPTCAAGRLECQGARQLQRHRVAARPGLEPGPPVSETGVVPVPPPRTVHSLRSGRRDSNSQPPASEAGALPLRHVQCRY